MEDFAIIGERNSYGGGRRPFGVPREYRRHHTYIIGGTGLGKTTLLENWAIQDIEAGEGIAYFDPHGNSARRLLDHIPPSRADDLIFFNPADLDRPVGFNIFDQGANLPNHLRASTIVATFKHLWFESWGQRLEYVLSNAIETSLDAGQGSLLTAQRLLSDKAYRARIIPKVRDHVLQRFWTNEFETLSPTERSKWVPRFKTSLVGF